MRAIDSVTLIKKVRMKANSKPWCVSVISAVQKRDKLYSRYKKSSLEADKSDLKPQRYFCKRCYTDRKALTLKKISSKL